MNPAGVGSAILGVIVLLSLFIPWVIFLVSYDQEVWGGVQEEWENMSYTLLAAADTLEMSQPRVLFGILLVLALLSISSIVLPRFVVAIVAVSASSSLLSRGSTSSGSSFWKHFFADFAPPGVGAATFPFLWRTAGQRLLCLIFPASSSSPLNGRRQQR